VTDDQQQQPQLQNEPAGRWHRHRASDVIEEDVQAEFLEFNELNLTWLMWLGLVATILSILQFA
jgi:hypothetical protein